MSKEFVFTHWTALDSEPEDSTYPQSNTCSGRSHPAPISNIQSYHTYVTYAHKVTSQWLKVVTTQPQS